MASPSPVHSRSPFRQATVALMAVLAAWTWMFLTVHYNYSGNWTALFCIRASMPVPAFLKSENLYIFPNSEGYDGQVYHLIAHDPWMQKGSASAIADVSFRYQRILVPALAWILACGQDRWIHAAYFAVILAFVFLGVYWTAGFAVRIGRPALWGLVFLFAPATIVSLDRMTVDIALAAFVAGFAFYTLESKDRPSWKILVILACAALTRETALPIIAGYAVYLLTRRGFLQCVLAGATVLPAAAWYLYLRRNSQPSPVTSYLDWIPFAGFAQRVVHPAMYASTPWRNTVAITCDYLAMAGVALALVFAARLALRRRWDAQSAAVYALAIATAFVRSPSVWQEVYAFGRVLTPLLLLAAFQVLKSPPLKSTPIRSSGWIAFAPLLLPDASIALALWRQIQGVILGLLNSPVR
jgi:hypothetical protein